MKIKTKKWKNYWYYGVEWEFTQKQFDYVFKYLDFNKLEKREWIYFNNEETEEWFHNTYINSDLLEYVYKNSPKGYEWLKDNWNKSVFNLCVYYPDKQELKIIVNKIINIELTRG